MKLDALLKKRADIERAIEAAQFAETRKKSIGELAAQAGVLDATDDEIMAALKALAGRRVAATGTKQVSTAPQS